MKIDWANWNQNHKKFHRQGHRYVEKVNETHLGYWNDHWMGYELKYWAMPKIPPSWLPQGIWLFLINIFWEIKREEPLEIVNSQDYLSIAKKKVYSFSNYLRLDDLSMFR